MSLLLLRHAHTVANGPPKRFQGQAESDLSPEGWAAARALGPRLPPVVGGVTSPLRRCRQTLEALALPDTLPIREDRRLMEIDLGRWSNRLESEVLADPTEAPRLAAWRADPLAHPPPEGETLPALWARVRAGVHAACLWAESLGATEARPLLVITHGGVLRALAVAREGASWRTFRAARIANLARVALACHLLPPPLEGGGDSLSIK